MIELAAGSLFLEVFGMSWHNMRTTKKASSSYRDQKMLFGDLPEDLFTTFIFYCLELQYVFIYFSFYPLGLPISGSMFWDPKFAFWPIFRQIYKITGYSPRKNFKIGDYFPLDW